MESDSDNSTSEYSEYSDSDTENEYDFCSKNELDSMGLPFDPTSLENIILSICDKFDFRVILNDNRVKGAVLVTSGLTLAGTMVGKHYGGKFGAAVGGAIGGVCGVGIIAVSMRGVWKDIKGKLSELFDIVYDYLAGLGIEDYTNAVTFLMHNSSNSKQLAIIIMHVTSNILGKKVLSSLTAA